MKIRIRYAHDLFHEFSDLLLNYQKFITQTKIFIYPLLITIDIKNINFGFVPLLITIDIKNINFGRIKYELKVIFNMLFDI